MSIDQASLPLQLPSRVEAELDNAILQQVYHFFVAQRMVSSR
jgi:hypothetical protein